MKRADIQVGVEYAVLSPSAKNRASNRYAPSHKHVKVLSVEPVWTKLYRGWGSSKPVPTRRINSMDMDDNNMVTADDWTQRVNHVTGDEKRSVRVLVRETRGYRFGSEEQKVDYSIQVVPISQVAMTWTEWTEIRNRANAQKVLEDAQDAIARTQKEEARVLLGKRLEAMRALLVSTDLSPRVLEGQVVLAGPWEAIMDAAFLVSNA